MDKRITGIKRLLLCAVFIIVLCMDGICLHAEEPAAYKKYDIVVAIDVSGSMKQTDSERVAFETIELLVRLCGSNDRFGVVAFNDTIVYNSGLVLMSDEKAKSELLANLEQITYAGETDNGLGMREAVSLLTADRTEDSGKMLIYLADGVTDLERSNTGRTMEESEQDMQWSTQQAVAYQIPVFTFGFTGSFGQDMDELTAVSAKTGGSYNACAGPLQMMNMISSIFITNKAGTLLPQDTITIPEKMGEYPLTIGEREKRDVVILFQTSQKLEDFKAVMQDNNYEMEGTAHCQIIKVRDAVQEDITLVYTGEENARCIIMAAEWIRPEPLRFREIVFKKRVMVEETPDEPTIWERYHTQITTAAVAGILLLTAIICIVIVRAFFGKKRQEKDETQLQGYLYAAFIDLKSRNDIPPITWNLADYPQEGVTLKELFEGEGIKEDLPELDRICLYPSEPGQILLVHCTGGGIFIDDRNISANVPAKLRSGETIYVAFPENASEFSIKYQTECEENREALDRQQ
ncbi:MAG: VWA domain-containing protein [Lachnospiraceae bacterium]|nr:VWA domain-containing protein [Lachnospiraceae bacterium]